MNKPKIILIVCLLLITGGVFSWSLMNKLSQEPLSPPHKANLPLPSQPPVSPDQALLVDYQATPQEPYFHGPCPITSSLQEDIRQRNLPLGFNNEKDKRQWQILSQSLEAPCSLETFKKRLKDFVLVLVKLQHPQNHRLMGNSERGDLMAYTRVAICDEIAILHHHLKGGIDPAIGQDYSENTTLTPSKQERVLFEVFYRSCHLTTANAFRFGSVLFTRAAFYPEKQDWNLILKTLDIDPQRPNEAVCTYKNR